MFANRWPMAGPRLSAAARRRRSRHHRPAFLVDHAKLGRIAAIVERHWPEAIDPAMIGDPDLIAKIEAARLALLEALDCLILARG